MRSTSFRLLALLAALAVLSTMQCCTMQKDYSYLNTDRRDCAITIRVTDRMDKDRNIRSKEIAYPHGNEELCGIELKKELADSIVNKYFDCPPPYAPDTLVRIIKTYYIKK